MLATAVALFTFVRACSASAQDLAGKGIVVRLIKGEEEASVFQHLIVQRGLEALGYPVEKIHIANYPTFHLAVAHGDVDYTVHHRQPLRNVFL